MEGRQRLDFLSAFGEEFCNSLSPTIGEDDIAPQGAYEVVLRALGNIPSPEMLGSLFEEQIEQIHAECRRYFEDDRITIDQIRFAVERTIARW